MRCSLLTAPTLAVKVSPLNVLSDCSLREEVKRKFYKTAENLRDGS